MTPLPTSHEKDVKLRSGATMPIIGLGTWESRDGEAYDAVRAALDVGYRHIDTATNYGNEEQVGRAVADSDVDREQVFLTTKLPPADADRPREVLEQSLRALGTDHVDLWLIHWPPADGASPDTWQQLLAAREDGLATDVGVSNYSPAQVDELLRETGEAPAVNQVKWSIPLHDADRLAHSRDRGVVLEGYSPFKEASLHDDTLVSIADAHGVTPTQVVLRWHVQHGIVVIPKSVRRERIAANFDIFGFDLDEDQMDRLDALGESR